VNHPVTVTIAKLADHDLLCLTLWDPDTLFLMLIVLVLSTFLSLILHFNIHYIWWTITLCSFFFFSQSMLLLHGFYLSLF